MAIQYPPPQQKFFLVDLQKKIPKYVCNQKLIIVIVSEGQIDALPWIAEGYWY